MNKTKRRRDVWDGVRTGRARPPDILADRAAGERAVYRADDISRSEHAAAARIPNKRENIYARTSGEFLFFCCDSPVINGKLGTANENMKICFLIDFGRTKRAVRSGK